MEAPDTSITSTPYIILTHNVFEHFHSYRVVYPHHSAAVTLYRYVAQLLGVLLLPQVNAFFDFLPKNTTARLPQSTSKRFNSSLPICPVTMRNSRNQPLFFDTLFRVRLRKFLCVRNTINFFGDLQAPSHAFALRIITTHRSILNRDLDILFWWRDDFVLLSSFQGRQLLHGSLDDVDSSLYLFLGNDQWWCKTDDVLVRRFCQ